MPTDGSSRICSGGEYGFQGIVMSDGVAIDQLDAMTGDRTVSGAVALEAGVDMGLWDTGFAQLEEAVERGLVSGAPIRMRRSSGFWS